MRDADERRRILARTQGLMAVASLLPLFVLFFLSGEYLFPALQLQGQDGLIFGVVAALVFCALAVVLGYVLVRRDTVRTIEIVGEGERRLDRLHEASVRLSEIEELDAAREQLLSVAMELVQAQQGALWVVERGDLVVVAAKGLSLERARALPLPIGQGLVGGVAQTRVPVRTTKLGDTDRTWDDRCLARTNSAMVVPLEHRDTLVAVLDLRNHASGGEFSVADEQLVIGLTRQATLALDNASFRTHTGAWDRHMTALVRDLTERLCWHGHIENVQALSERLAERLNLAPERRRALRTAAVLHDVGLVDCPQVRSGPVGGPGEHAAFGAQRMEGVAFWAEALPIVKAHHETMDGRGPLGLHGFAVPLTARILALAEYVDTVTNPESPWGQKTLAEVITEIQRPEDLRFDPQVVEALMLELNATGSIRAVPPDALTEI